MRSCLPFSSPPNNEAMNPHQKNKVDVKVCALCSQSLPPPYLLATMFLVTVSAANGKPTCS